MKNPPNEFEFSRIWLRAMTLTALASALFVVGCSTQEASCCAKDSSAKVPISERSLYQIDSSWTNDAGASLRLSSLAGRPLVVTMFFAKCEYACPLLVYDMKRVEAALPGNLRTNVGFVLVSFDTERDTPAVLAAYRKSHELPANWILLRGGPDDVLELAALLGVKFKKDARGQFNHSNMLTVLNAGGEVAHQQVGLNQAPQETVKHLVQLLHP